MKEITITTPLQTDCQWVERCIDQAISESGLQVTMRATLKRFPGCIHWHLKHGRESGTLEITLWPLGNRAWFTIQSGRQAAWIEAAIKSLDDAIQRQLPEA